MGGNTIPVAYILSSPIDIDEQNDVWQSPRNACSHRLVTPEWLCQAAHNFRDVCVVRHWRQKRIYSS